MRTEQFPKEFFQHNREALLEKLPPNSLAVLWAAEPMVRNGDQLHPFRQDSNFFYFTGITQPGCFLILKPEGSGKHTEILFLPPVDPLKETWEGKMLRKEEGGEISGIQNIQDANDFEFSFHRLQRDREVVYLELNDIFPDQSLTKAHRWMDQIRQRLAGLEQKKLSHLVLPLRSQKQPLEIEQIKKSLHVMKGGFERLAKRLQPGVMEYQLEAELTFQYLDHGCERHGFDVIVAGGKNACTLHYTENTQPLKDGDLVLVDTGAELGMYSGDITRVFPVNGTFSPRQKKCYKAVLEVNHRVIKAVKAHMSFTEISKLASEIQGEVYQREGFVKTATAHQMVSLHRIGHTLGLDVHDVTQADLPLPVGAVITVEPGLYLPEEAIGIRIEDNICLTLAGCDVLSKEIPNEVELIEALVRG